MCYGFMEKRELREVREICKESGSKQNVFVRKKPILCYTIIHYIK